MKKSKTITRICLWVEYISVFWMPMYFIIASILCLVFFQEFIKDKNITSFTMTEIIPCTIAVSTVIGVLAIWRWCAREMKIIDEELKQLREKKDGTS